MILPRPFITGLAELGSRQAAFGHVLAGYLKVS